jgi:hypothetical protein
MIQQPPSAAWRLTRTAPRSAPRRGPVGCVNSFMQIVGTRGALRRAGRVDAPGLAEPHRPGSDRRRDWAVPAQALGVDDAGCSAGHRSAGPAADVRGGRSAASQDTRYGRSAPSAPVGVGVGRLDRRDQHLGALRAERIIEPTAELRVAIANEEAHAASLVLQAQQLVAGLLGDLGGIGVGGHPGQVHPASVQFDAGTARTVAAAVSGLDHQLSVWGSAVDTPL